MTRREVLRWVADGKRMQKCEAIRRAEAMPGGVIHAWAMVRVHRLGGQAKVARMCGTTRQRIENHLKGISPWPVEIIATLAEAQ